MSKLTHVHFIGIGGVGMSGIAQILLGRGVRVSGSDPAENAATERLQAGGATIYREQTAGNIERESPELVVVTAAVPESNAELAAARASGTEVVSRAEMLGRMMAEHSGSRIAVSGTHGKTTTTAMISAVLLGAGLDPTVLIGGEFAAIGGNVRVGSGDVVVAEACEAYDSFLSLQPDIAVITNVEADHLDHYGSEEGVFAGFARFISRVPAGGLVVWCANDPGVQRLIAAGVAGARRSVTYGQSEGAPDLEMLGFRAEGPGCRFKVKRGEETLGEVLLSVPGLHNALNALAAVAVGLELGVAFEACAAALAEFHGTGRRFEKIGERDGIVVVDDYAHHPTEIRATLAAAREAYPDRRVVALFQPHLYSRTRDFLPDFGQALSAADCVLVTDIYAAREKPIPGVHASDIVRETSRRAPKRTALYVEGLANAPAALRWVARPGDLVLSLGAGDVREAAEAFLAGKE